MATKVEIKGNFLLVSDTITRARAVQLPINLVVPTRIERGGINYFGFEYNTPVANGFDQTYLFRAGRYKGQELGAQNDVQQYEIPETDIVDANDVAIGGMGGQWTTVDEFDEWLCDNLGGSVASSVRWGDIFGTLSDQTDLQTILDTKLQAGDNVSDLVNDAGYSTDQFEERFDQFNATLVGVWETVVLVGAPADMNISVLVCANSNNTTSGVREVGSVLNRLVVSDNDSPFPLTVKTDSMGQIQVYTTNITTDFYVISYNN